MSRRRLLIVSFSRIVDDARVMRQVRLLTPRYDVVTCGYGPAPASVREHLAIPDEIVWWHKDRRLLLQRRFAAAYRRAPVVEHLWPVLRGQVFDIILANEADTVPLALAQRPRFGVHADLHEFAPAQNPSARWRAFVAPYYRWLCREYVTRASSVTTVSQGLRDGYRRDFGLEADVVPNAAPYADMRPGPVPPPGEAIRLVHSGNAQPGRHLELLIDAVRRARRAVTLDLYLMPTDTGYLAELRRLAAATPGVTVRPPVPHTQLVDALNAYDVGLHVLPPATYNHRWALPNKLFDYVQARLGLVVGPSPEMARLVRDHALGAVTDDFTAASLAAQIDGLDAARVTTWKAASHRAAAELAAERAVVPWQRAIDALVSEAGQPPA